MPADLHSMEETCRRIGRVIGEGITAEYGGNRVGFALLLFDFGGKGHLTYISNAQRDDMVEALREFIRKHEGGIVRRPRRRRRPRPRLLS